MKPQCFLFEIGTLVARSASDLLSQDGNLEFCQVPGSHRRPCLWSFCLYFCFEMGSSLEPTVLQIQVCATMPC